MIISLNFAEIKSVAQTRLIKFGQMLFSLYQKILAGIVILVLSMATTQVANAEAFTELFGYPAAPQGNASDFPKWISMLEHYNKEQFGPECAGNKGCITGEWNELIDDLRGKKADEQLQAVNRFVNSQSYVVDEANYGEVDFWATPLQFLENGGDC